MNSFLLLSFLSTLSHHRLFITHSTVSSLLSLSSARLVILDFLSLILWSALSHSVLLALLAATRFLSLILRFDTSHTISIAHACISDFQLFIPTLFVHLNVNTWPQSQNNFLTLHHGNTQDNSLLAWLNKK